MNKTKKSISCVTSALLTALALAITLCTAFAAFSITAQNSINSELDSSVCTAESAVKSYNTALARNTFLFSDKLYSKANMAAASVNAKTSQEEFAKIARNLYLDSIMLTDAEGNCVAVYPESKKINNISDDSTARQFITILKGISFKSTSTPVAVDGSDNEYSLLTAINRTDDAGLLIIGATVDNYNTVSGKNIANVCDKNTVVAKDDIIISSSFANLDKTTLSDLDVDKNNIDGDSFKISVNGESYMCKAKTVNDYVVLAAVNETVVYSIAAPSFIAAVTAAVVVMIIILAVTFLFLGRKKK